MKQEMININANLLAEPTFSSFDKEGETVEVANFTLVKKYGKGKEYINCAAYGEKSEKAKEFAKGDLKMCIRDRIYKWSGYGCPSCY